MSENDNVSNVMTLTALCVRWSCSRKSLLEAIKEGRLHVFRIGKRSFRVTMAEVVRYEQAKDAA